MSTAQSEYVEILEFNLKRVRKKLGLTQNELADSIEVKRSTYASYEKGIVAPQEVLDAIHKKHKVKYEEFTKSIPEHISNISNKSIAEKVTQSLRVTIKERGSKSSSGANAVLLEENEYVVMMIPLVNKYAYAGYQAGFGDDEYIESLPRVPMMANKEHKGKYFAFEVKGDSMDNGLAGSYQEGMILHARELPKPHWKDKLHIHKWKNWVIVTKSDGILFKQIINHNRESGIITIHSLNEEYKDFEMSLDNVAQLLNVVGGNFK